MYLMEWLHFYNHSPLVLNVGSSILQRQRDDPWKKIRIKRASAFKSRDPIWIQHSASIWGLLLCEESILQKCATLISSKYFSRQAKIEQWHLLEMKGSYTLPSWVKWNVDQIDWFVVRHILFCYSTKTMLFSKPSKPMMLQNMICY